MIHLYALATSAAPVEELRGIDDAPVTDVDCEPLHAAVSEHPHPPQPSTSTALRHAEVVEAIVRAVPALPVRFGASHRDVETLRARIRSRLPELQRAVARTGGRLEFVVRGDAPSPEQAATARTGTDDEPAAGAETGEDPGTGTAYLQRRLATVHALRAAHLAVEQRLDRLTARLEPQAAAVERRVGPHGPEDCYLVPLEEVAAFEATARGLAEDHGLVLGGPWAPYTFATAAVPA